MRRVPGASTSGLSSEDLRKVTVSVSLVILVWSALDFHLAQLLCFCYRGRQIFEFTLARTQAWVSRLCSCITGKRTSSEQLTSLTSCRSYIISQEIDLSVVTSSEPFNLLFAVADHGNQFQYVVPESHVSWSSVEYVRYLGIKPVAL